MGNTVQPSVSLPRIPVQSGPAEASPLQPGFRMAPAKIGRTNATSVVIWIQCPLYCSVDHVAEPVCAVEDITHMSDPGGFFIHSFLKAGATHELFAAIQSDPVASDLRLRAAHIAVEDGGNDYAYLTPDMAEQLADELIGFASHLRHLSRTARQANKAAGERAV